MDAHDRYDAALEQIETAVTELAKQAGENPTASYALKFATAANQLAEARAWMITAAQPHGGAPGFGD